MCLPDSANNRPGRNAVVAPRRNGLMQPSMFNVQVPLPERNEVLLMNTFTDAQLVVSSDVAALLERAVSQQTFSTEEREALKTLSENGFLVTSREDERRALEQYFTDVREDREQLRV